ncbi:MAG: lamin tail domain-containing protein [Lentimicrobiaceae bacterium]|jgi:hypothetical protein|nr:lamin tail domain-containing protein [Lentimicrobiaceae bacterium]
MKKYLCILLLFPSVIAAGQVIDDFSDGDFTHNPTWSGSDTIFTVNSAFQLQLNATDAGRAWLSTPIESSTETVEWRFWIRENFTPSGNNFCDVFLSSNMPDLTVATQAYFLRFGEAGSNDAIELYRKTEDGNTLICRGTNGLIASSFALSVKVVHDKTGKWQFFVDPANNGMYALEAEGTDNTYDIGGFFGFLATYTKSNSTKFYFDNVYVGAHEIDTTPPTLLSCIAKNTNNIELAFDESLDVNALNTENYFSGNGLGNPTSVQFGTSASVVNLFYENGFENGFTYTLTINNIKDISGNVAVTIQTAFCFYIASEYDILINEIMADPSPVVGLPEWEYIELYNASDFAIDLTDWQLNIGTSTKTIGTYLFESGAYLLLCHSDAVQELSSYGNCIGFSSFQIPNAEASLSFVSKEGTVVSRVSFTDLWYNDSNKKNGGWSLEQINTSNPCAERTNWTASVNASGGTPGSENSVNSSTIQKPTINRLTMASETILHLWFDQQMSAQSIENIQAYQIKETQQHPTAAYSSAADLNFVELVFAHSFSQGTLYTLVLSDLLTNCVGIEIENNTEISFGIPDEIAKGDILINEILFNPIGGGVDYVELYNYSDKTIDISQLQLGAIRHSFPNPADTTLRAISTESRLFLPQTYLLLSTNSRIVGEQYRCATDNFLEMSSFPSYPNTSGHPVLVTTSGLVIDEMQYAVDMHYPLLNTVVGVSLERISFDSPSNEPLNWHSAAESVGFGTPGYENSMKVIPQYDNNKITVYPEAFSPDGDGFEDVTLINYQFDEAGYTLNMYILDAQGQQKRHLIKNSLVSQQGSIPWDGLDEKGNRVSMGIYVLYTEVFDLNGNVKKYKKAIVVASR